MKNLKKLLVSAGLLFTGIAIAQAYDYDASGSKANSEKDKEKVCEKVCVKYEEKRDCSRSFIDPSGREICALYKVCVEYKEVCKDN